MIDHDDSANDAMLVARVRMGEQAAFGPLVQRYYASVVRLCARLLATPLDAQDVAQEAVLQAFLHLARLREPARFGAWLHAIAANLCRMALRRRSPLSLNALGDGAALLVQWPALPTPEKISAARETHDAIVAALAELSSVNREVVIRFYLEGYSYDELAVLLGVPASTIKGRLFKGRRQLRRALEPFARETLITEHSRRKEAIMDANDMINVVIDSIRTPILAANNVVVLREEATQRIVPIFVGSFEGDAIAAALAGTQFPRPRTHDLTLSLLETLGAQVQQIVINKLVNGTFYCEITLAQGGQRFQVDARPSDGFALAVRCNAPIYIARAVMESAGGDDDETFWNKMKALHEELQRRIQ